VHGAIQTPTPATHMVQTSAVTVVSVAKNIITDSGRVESRPVAWLPQGQQRHLPQGAK